MRNHLLAGIAAVALTGLGLAASPASATAISINTWYEFGFGTPSGSPLVSGVGFAPLVNAPDGHPIVQVGSPAWTITSTVPLTLYVQDMFSAVDQFDMFNNAANLGLTSADANNNAINCGNDITACIASAGNSRGTFLLPAGADSLTGERLCQGNNCAGGAAVFELTPAVPEPSSLAVLGAALLALAVGLGLVRRRDATPGPVA
jgi:hypothetical protein